MIGAPGIAALRKKSEACSSSQPQASARLVTPIVRGSLCTGFQTPINCATKGLPRVGSDNDSFAARMERIIWAE
jgi:hypothetical protein